MTSNLGSKIKFESSKTLASVATCASSTPEINDDTHLLTPPKAPKLRPRPDPVYEQNNGTI